AVFGVMRACALLKLPIHVVGVAPLTPNMPSGSAYKPGDIVRTYNGKTIEVLNTDAEGRVLLSDALAWTEEQFKPEAMVDLATLTGACSVALGSLAIAGMGTDDKLLRRIVDAGENVHELVWPLPFWDEYDEHIKTEIADVKNLGGRQGGTITGGRFLRKFVKDTPWVHLDIASTAWDEGAAAKFNPEYSPKHSATGVGVRLMVEMLRYW
ncbi:MAG TPA: leucyl aminopeptidase, partial [Burkholderiales bacterium]|nr:leucyl aminopeptidase [Burkholderiales bacterium]